MYSREDDEYVPKHGYKNYSGKNVILVHGGIKPDQTP